MISTKRQDVIWKEIYNEPCSLDFDSLNIEERSFAIGIVISAGKRSKFKAGHFDKKQIEFLEKAKKSLCR